MNITPDPKKKYIFFKTVRSDGSSVWANGPLRQVYEIGKRYRFPKKFPAHVFLNGDGGFHPETPLDASATYINRKEGRGGNRVLICFGNLEQKQVIRLEVEDSVWDLDKIPKYYTALRWCSTDFQVIGEIALPVSFNGVRPQEDPRYKFTVKTGKLKVNLNQ